MGKWSHVKKFSKKSAKKLDIDSIGIYSVNTKDEKIIEIQNDIHNIVFSHEGILQMHGFYLDEQDKTISFDIIIDFSIKNREEVY